MAGLFISSLIKEEWSFKTMKPFNVVKEVLNGNPWKPMYRLTNVTYTHQWSPPDTAQLPLLSLDHDQQQIWWREMLIIQYACSAATYTLPFLLFPRGMDICGGVLWGIWVFMGTPQFPKPSLEKAVVRRNLFLSPLLWRSVKVSGACFRWPVSF